jgi:hypothetical protein
VCETVLSYCGTLKQFNDDQLDCSAGNTCIAEADCGDICFNRPNVVRDCSPETRAIGGTCVEVEGPGSKAAKSTKSSKGGDKSKASKSSPTFVPTYVVRDFYVFYEHATYFH